MRELVRQGYRQPLRYAVFNFDSCFPGVYRRFSGKKEYPTAVCLIGASKLRLYKLTRNKKYLASAEKDAAWLAKNRSRGYPDYCWGLPFKWQSAGAVYPETTPCSTITPYMTMFFLELYKQTKNAKYLSIAKSTAKFFYGGLNRNAVAADKVAFSYTPLDEFYVINASSYAAVSLALVGGMTRNRHYLA
ncbi:MAG: hypothetical protein ACP5IG_04645, partial [Candidatus Micrarchaeia archaeon]